MKSLVLKLFLALQLIAAASYAAPGLTLQGRLLNPDGSETQAANITFVVQIRSPGTENCLLYQEQHTLSTLNTGGVFAITVGKGTRAASSVDGGYSLERIFSNRGTLDFSSVSSACASGTSYTPGAKDDRKLVYSFNDNSGNGWQTVPVMSINYAPLAVESLAVGGFDSSNILRVENAGIPGAAPALTTAQATELMNLITAASTVYVKPGSAVFTAAPKYNAAPVAADDLVNKAYVDAQVAAGLPNVGTAGTYTKVTTDAQGRVTAGATLAESDIPSLTTAGKVDGGAINAGTIGGSAAINTTGNIVTGGTVSGNTLSGNQLRVYNGANYVQFTAPNLGGSNVNYVLPAADGSANQVLKTDGAGNLSWISPSAGSVTDVTASAPLSSSGGATPNITIAQANTTTAGYLSSADWNTFNNKLGTASTFSGDVSGTSSTMSVDKIKGKDVVPVVYGSGQFLRYDGTNWVNAALTAGDIPAVDSAKITDGTIVDADINASAAIARSKIAAGTASHVLINDGSGNMSSEAQLAVSRGGTGLSGFGNNSVIVSNATGTALNSLNCTSGQVIKFDASGYAGCGADSTYSPADASYAAKGIVQFDTDAATSGITVASGVASVNAGTGNNQIVKLDGTAKLPAVDGRNLTNLDQNTSLNSNFFKQSGNSLGATAVLGTADNQDLKIITNNTDRVTVLKTGNVGVGTAAPDASALLDVSSTTKGVLIPRMTTAQRDAITAPATGLQVYNTSDNKLNYYNGTAWTELGVAGSGLSSLNGLGGTSHTFATGTSGTDFGISSVGSTHTFNIPTASATNRGALSSADWTTFNNKLDTSSTFSGDVSGTSSTMSVDKIKGKDVVPVAYGSGQFLRYDGTNWVNAALTAGDIPAVDSAKITDGTIVDADISASAAIARSKMAAGTASHVLINDGSGNMSSEAQLAVSRGGTGLSGFGNNSVIVSNATGTALSSLNCTSGQVIKFDASGYAGCGTDTGASGNEFVNGGNSFTADATLGTNDNYALSFETNNTTRMTILNDGNVGIGTASPSAKFEISGTNRLAVLPTPGSGSLLNLYTNTTAYDKTDDSNIQFDWPINIYLPNSQDYHNGIAFSNNSSSAPFAAIVAKDTDGGSYYSGGLQFRTRVAAGNLKTRLAISDVGSVGIGTTAPGASALLDISSTTKGVLIPRMTAAQRDAIASPATGLQVYNTDSNALNYYNGTVWTAVATGGSAGDILNGGNSFGADVTIGSNDNYALKLETNNTTRMTILNDGSVGIGTASPSAVLHVAGTAGAGVSAAPDALKVVGGTGGTNNNGGAINLTAGAGDGTGQGGAVTIQSGSGGGGGQAGPITIAGGNGEPGLNASVSIKGATYGNNPLSAAEFKITQSGSVTGGGISLVTGVQARSGNITLQTSNNGGDFGSSQAGGIILQTGKGFATDGGGDISLTAGAGGTTSSGGLVSITAGAGGSSNINGSNVVINGGAKGGSGLDGNVLLASARGSVGIGTTSPGASALLDISSTTKGVLIPRMTAAQRDAIATPATGLQVYNTDTNALNYYNGTSWTAVATGAAGVSLSALTPATATNTIDSLNYAQTWNWSTAASETPVTINADALTTGSILNLSTSNASVNSTNGLLRVANTGASTSGVLARFQSNSTAGSGMTILANGKVGVGIESPSAVLAIKSAGGGNLISTGENAMVTFTVDYQGSISSARNLSIARQTVLASNLDSFATAAAVTINPLSSFSLNLFDVKKAGSSKFVIDNAGNVGIGTDSPTSKLHGVTTLNAATGNEVAYALDYTTNKATSGNDTGLLIKMTDTASPGTSLPLDIQVGGISKFSVDNTGKIIGDGSGLTNISAAPAGATGQIQFNSGSGSLAASSLLFWDNTNYFLGIRNATPPVYPVQASSPGGTNGTAAFMVGGILNPGSQPYTPVSHSNGSSYSGVVNAIVSGGDTVGAYHAGVAQKYGETPGDPNYFSLIGIRMNNNGAWDTSVPGALVNGDYLPGIGFAGQTNNTPGGTQMGAAIQGRVDGTVSNGVLPTSIVFRTTATSGAALAERLRITSSGNVGIGTATANEKLTVNGAIQIGTTSNANPGTIRWDGTNFQAYNGTAWTNLIAQSPPATACDTVQTFSTPGTYAYTVPATFGTITVRVWGAGGSGGAAAGWGVSGNPGANSSVSSLGLVAGGGAGGPAADNAPVSGGAGGTASGGSVNINGNSSASISSNGVVNAGASAPNGGAGGNPAGDANATAGAAPGGGGGATRLSGYPSPVAAGGGSGAYVEKTYTMATLNPNTYLNDIVVGAGGAAVNLYNLSGAGGNGRVSITCASAGAPVTNDRGVLFMDGGNYATNSNFTYTSAGNLGIGVPSPTNKLEVAGAIRSTAGVISSAVNPIATGGTVDLATGNTHTLASVGGSTIALSNMVDGGNYSIIVEDTTSRTYTFTGCTNSYFKPANGATTASTRTVYGLLTVKKGANWDCYITWSSGFQ